MSAGNYYRVSRYDGQFAATMESTNGSAQVEPGEDSVLFDTLADAIRWAKSEHMERGVRVDPDCRDAQ